MLPTVLLLQEKRPCFYTLKYKYHHKKYYNAILKCLQEIEKKN